MQRVFVVSGFNPVAVGGGISSHGLAELYGPIRVVNSVTVCCGWFLCTPDRNHRGAEGTEGECEGGARRGIVRLILGVGELR